MDVYEPWRAFVQAIQDQEAVQCKDCPVADIAAMLRIRLCHAHPGIKVTSHARATVRFAGFVLFAQTAYSRSVTSILKRFPIGQNIPASRTGLNAIMDNNFGKVLEKRRLNFAIAGNSPSYPQFGHKGTWQPPCNEKLKYKPSLWWTATIRSPAYSYHLFAYILPASRNISWQPRGECFCFACRCAPATGKSNVNSFPKLRGT